MGEAARRRARDSTSRAFRDTSRGTLGRSPAAHANQFYLGVRTDEDVVATLWRRGRFDHERLAVRDNVHDATVRLDDAANREGGQRNETRQGNRSGKMNSLKRLKTDLMHQLRFMS